MSPNPVFWYLFFKFSWGGMPPDPPSFSMAHLHHQKGPLFLEKNLPTLSSAYGPGSVIQLCMPRNKRSSAKRYVGVARVTSRRARKGFTLKYNPDTHWSSSFYKGLNELQYVDGRNMFIVNRDDAAGFRLDTLTTCKQYTTPVVQEKLILTMLINTLQCSRQPATTLLLLLRLGKYVLVL